MSKLKKIIATLMLLCLVAELVAVTAPESVEAAWEAGNGTIYVYDKDNDYKDGKYRINEKVVYNKNYSDYYGLTIQKIYLSNSAGKSVATWKSKENVLKDGGEQSFSFSYDFSTLPSDTYTFHFTVYSGYFGRSKSYTRKINHSAGKVAYSSAKYEVDTNGDRYVKVCFSVKSLKGYTPKYEIYDSKGKLVKSNSNCTKVSSSDCTYYIKWNFHSSDGWKMPDGEYTFKLTVNGKSASKKINLKTN